MKLDASISELARKNLTAILIALSEVNQSKVAELLGESGSTVSRFKASELERFAAMLAAVRLKTVDQDELLIAPEEKRALLKDRIRMAKRDLAELGDTTPGALDD